MTTQEIKQIISNGEGETSEFKMLLREPFILARHIAGFANAKGGRVLVGIKEPTEIVGCNPNAITEIFDKSLKALIPKPKTTLEFYEIEGKIIAIISVEPSSAITFANGSPYLRTGENTQVMDANSIQTKLLSNVKNVNSSSDIASLAKSIENQSKIIEELRNEVKQSGSLKNKLKDYVIGGIIGAVLGLIATIALGK